MAADSVGNELTDVLGYLSVNSRVDVKSLALEYLLGLTGSADGVKFIENNLKLVENVLQLLGDNSPGVQKQACAFLLNASASQKVARNLENCETFQLILPQIIDKDCIFADKACMLLSNLTRSERGCELCLQSIDRTTHYSLQKIFEILCNEKYNQCVELHHLAVFLSNMSRLKAVRMFLLDKTNRRMLKILPYVSLKDSVVRRKGIVGILRNCCFEYGR